MASPIRSKREGKLRVSDKVKADLDSLLLEKEDSREKVSRS
jgi:hypothetical protein